MDGRAPQWSVARVLGAHHMVAYRLLAYGVPSYKGSARSPAAWLATSVVTVTVKPTLSGLPGSQAIATLIDGIEGWALMLALAGLLIGAAMWALGSHSQNYQQSYTGKRAVLVSVLAALVIGVAPVLINFFFKTGTGIPNPLTS